MTIRVALHHRTAYHYDRPITVSPQVVRLRPAPHCRTPITSYSLQIQPDQHFLNWQQDPYGNFLARLVFPEKTSQFVVEVDLVAEMTVINPFDFFLEPDANDFPFDYSAAAKTQLHPYLALETSSPKLQAFVAGAPRESIGTVNFRARGRQLRDSVGARSSDQRTNTDEKEWFVPRFGLAAGATGAASGAGRSVCVGLFDSVEAGCFAIRRAGGNGGGFHRSACLGRGLSAWCRVGRSRPDIRVAGGGRALATGGDS